VKTRATLGVVAALSGVLLFAAPAAADPTGVHIRQVDASAFPIVKVTVSTTGTIPPSQIGISENGVPITIQSVQSLAQSGRTVDVVLALDTSNSVHGAPLAAALTAARSFVDQVPANIAVGLITFSDQVRVIQPITTVHADVLRGLDTITGTQSGTGLYDGVLTAAGMFSGNAQHNIVLLTDGSDVGSTADLTAAIQAAQSARATVFAVGLGEHVDAAVLRGMSAQTHGLYVPAVQDQLTSVYDTLAGQLSQQLVLTYRSHVPGGSEDSIVVTAGGATDTSTVLLPMPPPSAVGGGTKAPLLQGTWGMAVALGLAFAAMFLLIWMVAGAGVRIRRERELSRRMSAPSVAAVEPVPVRPDEGSASWIPQPIAGVGEAVATAAGVRSTLERKLERAGLPMTPGELIAASAAAAVMGGLIGGIALRGWVFGVVFAFVASAIPFLWLARTVTKRIDGLHEQLPDVLMILASSMRAGHSFLQALDTVAKEIGDPSGPEFSRVVAEIRLGRPADEALNALAERVGTEEFKWAMMAVNVQREVGGNLAEVLDTLAETVRERQAVRRQIKVLSAEGRLSIRILIALPPIMVLYLVRVNRPYMRLLWTTRIGWILIAIASILMLVGVVIARKIVKIDV